VVKVDVTGAVVMVAVHALGVLALWLRLRWKVRHEDARGRLLADLAVAMRSGGEVDEHRPDGSRLRVSVPPGRPERSTRGRV
jgi:hypothetical protein